MRRFRLFSLVLAVALATMCVPAVAESHEELMGSIANVKGPVHVLRQGQEVVAEKGLRLYPSDVIRTGEEAGVGVVLRDDTILSLGPSSELKMSEFKFKPDEGILGLSIGLLRGTLVYISGQIAKLAPGSVQIETPAGVAAIRGTELLIEVRGPKAPKDTEKPK